VKAIPAPKKKKIESFPKLKRVYLFLIEQIKKHGLSIILEQSLDKLQLELLFQCTWKECSSLYPIRGDRSELPKRFPNMKRIETNGICFFDDTVFSLQRKDQSSIVEQTWFTHLEFEDEGTDPNSVDNDPNSDDNDENSDSETSPASPDSDDDLPLSALKATNCAAKKPLVVFAEDSSEDEPLSSLKQSGSRRNKNAQAAEVDLANSSDDEPLSSLKASSQTEHSPASKPRTRYPPLTVHPTSKLGNPDTGKKKIAIRKKTSASVKKTRPGPIQKKNIKLPNRKKSPAGKKPRRKERSTSQKNAEPDAKKNSALQLYYALNVDQPRQPVPKQSKNRLPNATGSTAAVLCDLQDFTKLLEFSLCWHAFTKKEEQMAYEMRNDNLAIGLATRKMMELFSTWFYRGDNSVDTKTCKFHSHIHTVRNRREYGSLLQYDTGKGERHLKHTKHLASTAQKRGQDVFTSQTGDRILDHFVLTRADRVLEKLYPSATEPPTQGVAIFKGYALKGTPRFRLELGMTRCVHLNSKGKPAKGGPKKTMDPFLLNWLKVRFSKEYANESLLIWTDIVVPAQPNQDPNDPAFYRAHPHYDHQGSWYDWVMIKFQHGRTSTRVVPGKLLAFYRRRDGKDYGLAHCCEWKNGDVGPIADSLLCQHWKLEYDSTNKPILMEFELESIDEACLVVESGRDPKGPITPLEQDGPAHEQTVIRIMDRKLEWPIQFVKWGRELALDPENAYLLPACSAGS
jgi:hypothetical protein